MPGATIDLPTLVQRVRVDTSDMAAAEKRAAAMSKRLREAQDDTTKSSAKLGEQSSDTAENVEKVGDASGKAADKVEDLGDSAGGAAKEVEKLGDQVRRTRKETEDLGPATRKAADDVEALGVAARRARGGFRGLSPFLKPALYYGLSGFIAPAITAISALGGAGLAAAGGIAPAAGALAGLPALLGAVVSGSKAFSTATKGTLDAAKAIEEFGENSEEAQEALAGLTPEARKYAKALVPFVEESKKAGDAVRLMALPGLTRGLKAAFPAMKVFTAAAGDVGKVVGRTGEELGKFVGSKGFLTDLKTLAGANTTILSNLGKGAVPLVSAFRNIAIAASPMSIALSEATRQFAEFLNASTTKNKGKLTDFFDRAGRAAIRLSKALGNGIAAISRIAGIGANVFGGSDGITTSIEKAAKKFNDWTKSSEGKNSIQSYFEDIKPVAKELGLLTKDLLKGFADLARDPNTASMIRQIRTDLLPALVTLLDKSAELAPSIINIISRLAEIIAEIDPMTLEILAGALSATATALSMIAKYVPGFSEFVTLALLYAGIRKFPGLGGILPSLGALATGKAGKGGKGGGGTGGGGTTVVGGGTSSSKKAPKGKAPKVTGGAGGIGATAALLIIPQFAISPAEGAAAKGEAGVLSAQEIIAAYEESKKTQSDREAAAKALRESAKEIESSSEGFGGQLLFGINDAIAAAKGEPTLTASQQAAAQALRDKANSIDGGRGGTPSEFQTSKPSSKGPGGILGALTPPKAPDFGKAGGFLSDLGPKAAEAMDKVQASITTKLSSLRSTITGPGGLQAAFAAGLAGIPGLGTLVTSGLGARITTGLATARTLASQGATNVSNGVRTAMDFIPVFGSQVMTNLGTRITTGLATARTNASTGATNIANSVRTFLSPIPGQASGIISRAGTAISSQLEVARGNAARGAQNITSNVRTFLGPIPGIARTRVGMAAAAFGGFTGLAISALGNGDRLYAAGARLVNMLASGIRSAIGAINSAMSSVAAAIAAYVPGSPVKVGPLTKFNNGGVGIQLAEMLAQGLVAGGSQVSAAASTMVSGIGNPSVAATVSARNAIASAAPGLGGVPGTRTAAPGGGPVDRSLTFQFGDIIAAPEESASDAITRKMSTLQAAGVFG